MQKPFVDFCCSNCTCQASAAAPRTKLSVGRSPELMDFLRKNLEKYALNMCNHENANYGDVKMLIDMQPEDLMVVAIDCRFAKVDRKKLGDLVSDGGASSNLSRTFNPRETLQCTAGCGGFS